MKLIVGLGNPGPEFENTRHNVGYMVIDRLANTLGLTFSRNEKLKALIARSDDKKVILAKPVTFMNFSGESVRKITLFYKIRPNNVWLVYDDVDLPVGTARARAQGGGRSRHKGVVSIVQALGTPAFPRFRLGIAGQKESGRLADRPGQPADLKDYVLQPFDKRDLPLLEKAITWTATEILSAMKQGIVISRTLTKGV